jgi:HEAT repeat protein
MVSVCYSCIVKRRRVIGLLVSAVFLGLVIFYFAGLEHEPRYHGRALSYWLLMAQDTWSGIITEPGWQQTSDAIRNTGTNALPYLLEWMAYERPPWRTQAVAVLKKLPKPLATNQKLERWLFGPGEERARSTVWAFKILGPEARPIVPDLARMMDGSRLAASSFARKALDNLGGDALPPLLAAVASGRFTNRLALISWIQHTPNLGASAALALPLLINCASNEDLSIALEATETLGHFCYDSAKVVPALIGRLDDPRYQVRLAAATALVTYREDALIAVPALLRTLNDSDISVRDAAKRALRAIVGSGWTPGYPLFAPASGPRYYNSGSSGKTTDQRQKPLRSQPHYTLGEP